MTRIECESFYGNSYFSFTEKLFYRGLSIFIDMGMDLQKCCISISIFYLEEISGSECLDVFYEFSFVRFCFVRTSRILEECIMVGERSISFRSFFIIDFRDRAERRTRSRRLCRTHFPEARLYAFCEIGPKSRITPVKLSPIYRSNGYMNLFRKEYVVHEVSFLISLE